MNNLEKFNFIREIYNPKTEIDNFSSSEFRHTHNIEDWKVKPSTHAASQAMLRRPQYQKSDWEDLHKKAVAHVKNNNLQDGEQVFYSRKHRQGYVADVINKNKLLKVITVLDPGVSRAKSGTPKHMIESEQEFLMVHYVD